MANVWLLQRTDTKQYFGIGDWRIIDEATCFESKQMAERAIQLIKPDFPVCVKPGTITIKEVTDE